MRKRMLTLCGTVLATSSLAVTGAAQGACGQQAPLPPGGLIWPLHGAVTRAWSLDCASDRGHRGIDIAAASGEQISAAASGTVSFVGQTPAEGGGITVTVDHAGGLRTSYLHLAQAEVSPGESVSQGQVLGLSDGAPLHFGMKLKDDADTYFNPSLFLQAEEAAAEDAGTAPQPDSVPDPYTAAVPPPAARGDVASVQTAQAPAAAIAQPIALPNPEPSPLIAAAPEPVSAGDVQASLSRPLPVFRRVLPGTLLPPLPGNHGAQMADAAGPAPYSPGLGAFSAAAKPAGEASTKVLRAKESPADAHSWPVRTASLMGGLVLLAASILAGSIGGRPGHRGKECEAAATTLAAGPGEAV